MSTNPPTHTRQTQRAVAGRPSVASLEKDIQVLRRHVLMLRAELDEAGEVERFLRTRLRDLNASIRVDRARLAELEVTGKGAAVDAPTRLSAAEPQAGRPADA